MEERDQENKKLQEENFRLRAELEVLRAERKTDSAVKSWLAHHLSNFFVGKGLKKALFRLYNELPGAVSTAA